MPLSYRIDPEHSLILTTASGVLTDEHVLAHKKSLTADPDYDPSMKELTDLRAVTELDVTTQGVSAMAGYDRNNPDTEGRHRLALVASEDVVFGMARMYQMTTVESDNRVGGFRTMKEARAWLDPDQG
jgi:hypothetical protein